MSNQPEWYMPTFPNWINADFERGIGLRQRCEELLLGEPSAHPIRKNGYANFACDFPLDWKTGDGGCPGIPPAVEMHPFWDLRLVQFLLAVPVVPWCREKYLMRAAVKGVLPEPVRQRPKSPVAGFPHLLKIRQMAKPSLPPLSALAEYVDVEKLPEWPGKTGEDTDYIFRALSLHYWLLGK
jgi:asparagine synthase (glutamine-hydrolysing)